MVTFRWASLALVAVAAVEATQVMHRPAVYNNATINPVRRPQTREVHDVYKRAVTGKTQFAYFVNWGIYARNFREFY
jgi:chitinase